MGKKMDKTIELLDCTLRDGAYIVDAKFGTPAIKGIIKKMQDANVDIIECGWLKNTPHEEGTSFYHTPEDLKPYLLHPRGISAWKAHRGHCGRRTDRRERIPGVFSGCKYAGIQ